MSEDTLAGFRVSKMDGLPPDANIIGSLWLGGWSLLGIAMRGGSDWKDPNSGKFSLSRLLVALATALVLGQLSGAIATAWHWEGYATNGTAGVLGYLGAAVSVGIFERIFGLGKKDDTAPTRPVTVPANRATE